MADIDVKAAISGEALDGKINVRFDSVKFLKTQSDASILVRTVSSALSEASEF